MHDPNTVAFEIRYPWRKYGRGHATLDKWYSTYRAPFITIWHVDPLNFKGKCGCRGDDSCGWFRPPYTKEAGERIRELGRRQYGTIFEKQLRTKEGKDYAYICFEPNAYDAIYWAWRAINHIEKKQGVWQYGRSKNALTAGELEEIYSLSANPVDNLRHIVSKVSDEESCADFFMTLYRSWQRFNRPWYKHPRWHVWHWRFQVHPLQRLRRWLFDRCSVCGKRFGWDESPVSTWDGDTLWHSKCDRHTHPPVQSNQTPPTNIVDLARQSKRPTHAGTGSLSA